MKKYRYVLFDLDGTLTDPGCGIRNSVAYALRKMGFPEQTEHERNRFIGPPLQEGFRLWCGMEKQEVEQAVYYYREYYQKQGMFENLVYDGIEEMLGTLRANHISLIVATSKPEVYAKQILEHFHLSSYFTFIAGGKLDGTRCAKADVIQYALEQCGIKEISSAVMIGDRKHDAIGAVMNGIDFIGVLYGYGTREELLGVGADRMVETAEKLLEQLI